MIVDVSVGESAVWPARPPRRILKQVLSSPIDAIYPWPRAS